MMDIFQDNLYKYILYIIFKILYIYVCAWSQESRGNLWWQGISLPSSTSHQQNPFQELGGMAEDFALAFALGLFWFTSPLADLTPCL